MKKLQKFYIWAAVFSALLVQFLMCVEFGVKVICPLNWGNIIAQIVNPGSVKNSYIPDIQVVLYLHVGYVCMFFIAAQSHEHEDFGQDMANSGFIPGVLALFGVGFEGVLYLVSSDSTIMFFIVGIVTVLTVAVFWMFVGLFFLVRLGDYLILKQRYH